MSVLDIGYEEDDWLENEAQFTDDLVTFEAWEI
jgi:hypothetical protein